MAKVKIRHSRELNWNTVRSTLSSDLRRGLAESELGSSLATHHVGEPDLPQLTEIIYLAGASVPPHAHTEDEIIYVVAGTVMIGQTELGPGGSIFIEKMSPYAFNVGPQGARLVIFRPRSGARYINRDELLRLRKNAQTISGIPQV